MQLPDIFSAPVFEHYLIALLTGIMFGLTLLFGAVVLKHIVVYSLKEENDKVTKTNL